MNEIIVDGVNVKDCKRRTGKNSYCRYFKRPCADNNFNCIWKQCERLKADNERLKEEIKEIKKYQYEQEYLDKEIEEMQEALKTLAEGLNKRQMTLQEIKEFCKKEIEYFDNNDNYGQQADWIALLQKITKAEEE